MTGIVTGFDAIKKAVAGAPAPERDAGTRTGWEVVDEGWGRRAVDFATLSEPGNCREYVAIHHRLGISEGDRLVAIARDRNPDADIRVGDMHALPWDDASFDVATSFRGIWATTPAAISELHRVLVPGGRVGLTVWGHIKASPGAWALAPFRLADPVRLENQAAMVSLGRPGAGEDLLARCGFAGIERIDVPFVWEFADPQAFARALASTGPAYEAIQNVGEAAFIEAATDQARKLVRDGLPLRAQIAVAGYLARKRRSRRKASQ